MLYQIKLSLCGNTQKSCHTQLSSNLILNDLAPNTSWTSTYKRTKPHYKFRKPQNIKEQTLSSFAVHKEKKTTGTQEKHNLLIIHGTESV